MHSSQSYRGTIHGGGSWSNVEKCIRIAAKKQVPRFLWKLSFPEFGGARTYSRTSSSSGKIDGAPSVEWTGRMKRTIALSVDDWHVSPAIFFFFAFDFVILFRQNKVENRSCCCCTMIDTCFSRFFFYFFLINTSIFRDLIEFIISIYF